MGKYQDSPGGVVGDYAVPAAEQQGREKSGGGLRRKKYCFISREFSSKAQINKQLHKNDDGHGGGNTS